MTWKTINAILGLATVDQTFCQELLKNPLAAVEARQFELTPEEQEIFKKISAHDLAEFSKILLAELPHEEEYH
nr:Os1348 family NHLP clan protein [Ktedonobacteraceae bacterium]